MNGLRKALNFLFNYPVDDSPQIHPSVKIGKRTYISGRVTIDRDTYVNDGAHIVTGPNSRINIGRGCAISYGVHIRSRTHDPYDYSQIIEKNIEIGDFVWIGAYAIIREGISLGDNAIVGGLSIVTHDVPAYHVVGGVPARLLYVKDQVWRPDPETEELIDTRLKRIHER